MSIVLTGQGQVNGKILSKNVFKFRLCVGGLGEVLIIFGGNDNIKILWERACHCVINQNNTVSGSYFKF